MAKLAGGALGVRRGKVGAEVYSVTGGIQVVKQYQPVVANPNTDGQQIQRLKMMVVGKISKAITPSMLVGLGTRFNARAEFNKMMLRAAQARLSGEQGDWKAAVPATSLVFSKGEEPKGFAFGAATLSGNNRGVTLRLTAMPVNFTTMKLIAVAGGRLLDISNDFMATESYDDAPAAGGDITLIFSSPVTEGVNIYAVFGRPINRAAQLDRNGGSVTTDEFSIDGASTPTTAGIEWSKSVWVDFVAAPDSGSGNA